MISSCSSNTFSNNNTESGPKFKATALWRNLVAYVHRNVKQKRRRLILRGVGPTACFTGNDVCDTALLYLLMDHDNFRTTDLTREKARKLCQLLLEHQVFEPLSSGSSLSVEKKFDDSNNKYYKFTSTLDVALKQSMVGGVSKASTTSSEPDYTLRVHRHRNKTSADYDSSSENRPPELPQRVLPDGGVLHNPSATDLDCSGNIIQELLGLTSTSDPKYGRPSTDQPSGSHRTVTSHFRKMYNERVLGRRSSLDCEAALTHGILPRTISTGTGTAGVFKRKRSTLNIPGQSLTDDALLPSPTYRRSFRQRRASAEPMECSDTTPSQHRVVTGRCNRRLRNVVESMNTSQTCSHQPPPLGTRRPSTVNGMIVSPQGLVLSPHELRNCSGGKTVEKLARLTGEVIFSPAAIAEIRQEIALSQLSQIVDIPILEGLVCAGNSGSEDTGYDNTVFFNVEQHQSMSAGFNATDGWVQAAMEVFDYMPNGHKTTFDYQIGHNPTEYKLALYRSILKNYRARTESLLPPCHEQVHLAVLGLIMSANEQMAVLAVRLSSILLPCYLMAEVATLLEFLQMVSLTPDPKLKPSQNNNDVVLNDFSGIFFMGCKLLSMDQRRILLLLMMRYCDRLTQVPLSVETVLEKTIQGLKQGDSTPSPSTLFCNKLTSKEYVEQQRATTEQAIVSLVRTVIDDTTIPLKEKQRHIKQFTKHHRAVMTKHFSDIA